VRPGAGPGTHGKEDDMEEWKGEREISKTPIFTLKRDGYFPVLTVEMREHGIPYLILTEEQLVELASTALALIPAVRKAWAHRGDVDPCA